MGTDRPGGLLGDMGWAARATGAGWGGRVGPEPTARDRKAGAEQHPEKAYGGLLKAPSPAGSPWGQAWLSRLRHFSVSPHHLHKSLSGEEPHLPGRRPGGQALGRPCSPEAQATSMMLAHHPGRASCLSLGRRGCEEQDSSPKQRQEEAARACLTLGSSAARGSHAPFPPKQKPGFQQRKWRAPVRRRFIRGRERCLRSL